MINRARAPCWWPIVLAAALVVSLPWSTSATGIILGLWLLALIPRSDVASLRRVVATPAGGIPVLLWLLGLAGMLWAFGVPMAERWDGRQIALQAARHPAADGAVSESPDAGRAC